MTDDWNENAARKVLAGLFEEAAKEIGMLRSMNATMKARIFRDLAFNISNPNPHDYVDLGADMFESYCRFDLKMSETEIEGAKRKVKLVAFE